MDYQLVRSQRKTLALQVNAQGELVVRAPKHLPVREIEAFIEKKSHWIRRAQQRQRHRVHSAEGLQLVTGDQVPWLGQTLQVELSSSVSSVYREESVLYLPEMPLAQRQQALLQWYKQQAKPLYERKIEEHFGYFSDLGYARPKLHIKNMKTRWGSLSSKGNMSLDVKLMQLPELALTGVVAHELCHLVYMHHGPAFYNLLEQRFPRWRESDKLLKNSSVIMF